MTTYRRDGANRVTARFESGATMLLDGTLDDRVIATFFEYSGAVLMAESGPCEVADTSATSCPEGSALTEYAYYSAGGLNGGRLHTVSRYASTEVLVTTYGAYTALGEPGFVTDENGVTTELTYEGHNVTSRLIRSADGGIEAEWLYEWDNEKLVSVRFPEGNYEAYCYRAGASPMTSCSGDWTGQLQKVSKASSADGVTGWAEAIVYEYWGDGTLKNETRYANVSGSAVARYHRAYAADAHRRPTLTVTGATGTFAEASAFDGANNREAIGRAYNEPPPFCRSTGSPDATAGALSRLCAQMGFDRANRLRQLDLFADASSSTPTRACIDYDKRGNVSRVTTGCGSGDSCSMDATASTCGSSPGWSHDYLTDDFGNVVEVKLSGTDNGSGERGTIRFEFDARGNVIKQQTEAQRAASPARYLEFEYERLGRAIKKKEYRGGTPYTVLTWAYDDDSTTLADPPALCGAGPVRTLGRLRAVRDPILTRWFRYDQLGRVVKEVRNTTEAAPGKCRFHETYGAGNLHLELQYSLNGNLTQARYGLGRTVSYSYGSGGSTDRVSAIDVNYYLPDGGEEQRELISGVEWEPFGSLRKYKLEPAGVWVDYEKGAAQTEPSVRCASGALAETVDQTSRLRSLRVWTSEREVYRRTYTWQADEVARIDSCYLAGGDGGTEYVSEVYGGGADLGYDGLGRLKGATSPTFATMGGPMSQRKYAYDARGNTTSVVSDALTYSATFDTSSANRRDWVTSFGTDSWNKADLTWDRDGRLATMAGPIDSSGQPSQATHDYAGESAAPGSDTVVRAISVSTGSSSVGFLYYYDAMNRRLGKFGPTFSELYLHDTGHQLLVTGMDGMDSLTDDYVWLDDRPVAVIRSRREEWFGPDDSWVLTHHPDAVGNCSNNDDGVACGIYFVVSDHIGKPVLALDAEGRITGVGEYEPRGFINRVQMVEQSPHPYEKTSSATSFYTMQQKALGGLEVRFRAHFPMVDTEEDCAGNVREGVGVWSADETTLKETIGGHARGDVWSQWWSGDDVSGQRVLKLGWGRAAGNCYPQAQDPGCAESCPQSSGDGWAYSGFVLREYEYARNESGASPYFPNLRFPGHYWDAETELHENWHRYYSPFLGYLSPEPMLQRPQHVRALAQGGMSLPTYSYASNNPIRFIDPDGLQTQTGGLNTITAKCVANPELCAAMGLALATKAASCEGTTTIAPPPPDTRPGDCGIKATSCYACCNTKVLPLAGSQRHLACMRECATEHGKCLNGMAQSASECWPGGGRNP